MWAGPARGGGGSRNIAALEALLKKIFAALLVIVIELDLLALALGHGRIVVPRYRRHAGHQHTASVRRTVGMPSFPAKKWKMENVSQLWTLPVGTPDRRVRHALSNGRTARARRLGDDMRDLCRAIAGRRNNRRGQADVLPWVHRGVTPCAVMVYTSVHRTHGPREENLAGARAAQLSSHRR